MASPSYPELEREVREIMNRAEFSWELSQRSLIWAARSYTCVKCGAPPFCPRRNLNGIRRFGFMMARENKYPHPEWIDYAKLKKALLERGYQ